MEEIRGTSNDELINKLYSNSEHDYLLTNDYTLTKPHVDKLLVSQWIYDDEQDFIHPSIHLTTDQKASHVWRFEGIGWKMDSDGFWNGVEHSYDNSNIPNQSAISW